MFPVPDDIRQGSCPVLQRLEENFRNVPDWLLEELQLDHETRCQEFATVTLPDYREDPSTWPLHYFDEVLSLITPFIGYVRLLGCAAAKYSNLNQLQEELTLLPSDIDGEVHAFRRASYVKQAFQKNAGLHAELVAVVSESNHVRPQ